LSRPIYSRKGASGDKWQPRIPLVVLMGIMCAAAMYIPALHALAFDDHRPARIFFYYGTFLLFIAGAVGVATANHRSAKPARAQLLSIAGVFTVLPLFLALPFREVVGNTTYLNAVLEMVSALTTTGATLFDDPDRLPLSLHVWRALVAWLGGLFMWVAAVAILAPLRLGGFEVSTPRRQQAETRPTTGLDQVISPEVRMWRAARTMGPIYLFLTLNLALILMLAGDDPTTAAIHAMSTLSTSGISAVGGLQDAVSGRVGEVAVFFFLIFAVSRQTFAAEWRKGHLGLLRDDRELRIAAFFVAAVPLALFARHWTGALEVRLEDDMWQGLEALWGAMFTVLSFLTTTGFESSGWTAAQYWSGLSTPGLLLMGLSVLGGGVATTAGGVKLLRVYALYRHGRQEMALLVEPHAVAGVKSESRRVHPEGAQAAWIFFMLFAMSIAGLSALFALSGVSFEAAMVMTVAGLSTTGPLLSVAMEGGVQLSDQNTATKIIFAGAMVLGRLETLAIIALLNPEFWRR